MRIDAHSHRVRLPDTTTCDARTYAWATGGGVQRMSYLHQGAWCAFVLDGPVRSGWQVPMGTTTRLHQWAQMVGDGIDAQLHVDPWEWERAWDTGGTQPRAPALGLLLSARHGGGRVRVLVPDACRLPADRGWTVDGDGWSVPAPVLARWVQDARRVRADDWLSMDGSLPPLAPARLVRALDEHLYAPRAVYRR